MSNDVDSIGKYAKLALLASLAEPKSLSELGIFWYEENGRFYKKRAKEEIHQAVKQGILIKRKNKFKANTEKIVESAYSKITDRALADCLQEFWKHPFSKKTYLCCKAVKHMFNSNPEKAADSQIHCTLNMPFILERMQRNDSPLYAWFLNMQELDEYVTQININSEEHMPQIFKNLNEKTAWLENLDNIIKKSNAFIKEEANGSVLNGVKNGKT